MDYGWICPKCGSVYGPLIRDCEACNAFPVPPIKITFDKENTDDTTKH